MSSSMTHDLPMPTRPPIVPRGGHGRWLAVAATVVMAASWSLLAGPAAHAATPAARTAPAASPSVAREVAMARSRLAANLRAPHAGTAEATTHAASDVLGAGQSATVAAPERTVTGAAEQVARPASTPDLAGDLLGIDVASYQGDVDWSEVAAQSGSFAYVKATEGTYYVDSAYFTEQYDGSAEAGLIRGAYHFAVPNNSTGAAQADYFVANGGAWSADGHTLPGMLDIENNPYGAECYGLTQAQMVAWVASFDGEYKALTGRYPALYTNASWWDTCTGGSSVADQDPLSVAAWGPSPSPLPAGWSGYTIWQYTDDNALGTDGDAFTGSRAGLVALADGSTIASDVYSGQSLVPGQTITSSNDEYRVVMQTDGNLVEYPVGSSKALWESGTFGHPGAYVVMQTDGNLVIYDGGKALWSSGTFGRGLSYAVVQTDGNFVIYTDLDKATWQSGT